MKKREKKLGNLQKKVRHSLCILLLISLSLVSWVNVFVSSVCSLQLIYICLITYVYTSIHIYAYIYKSDIQKSYQYLEKNGTTVHPIQDIDFMITEPHQFVFQSVILVFLQKDEHFRLSTRL